MYYLNIMSIIFLYEIRYLQLADYCIRRLVFTKTVFGETTWFPIFVDGSITFSVSIEPSEISFTLSNIRTKKSLNRNRDCHNETLFGTFSSLTIHYFYRL